jgi:hypothetical protein
MRCEKRNVLSLRRATAGAFAALAIGAAACNATTPTRAVAKAPRPTVASGETISDPWIRLPATSEDTVTPPKPPAPAWMQPCTPEELRFSESHAVCAAREQEYFRRVAALDPAIDLGAPSDFNPAQSFDPDADLTSDDNRGMYLTCEWEGMTRSPSLALAMVPLVVDREEIFSNMWTGLDPAVGFAACKRTPRSWKFAEHVPACGDALLKNFALLYQRLPSKARDPGCRPGNLLDPAFRYAKDPACAPPASWREHGGIALDKLCAPVGIYLLLRAVTPYAQRGGDTFAQNIEYIAQTLGTAQRRTAKSTLATPECKLVPVKPAYMPKW